MHTCGMSVCKDIHLDSQNADLELIFALGAQAHCACVWCDVPSMAYTLII